MDVVEREIEMLTRDDVDELALLAKRHAAVLIGNGGRFLVVKYYQFGIVRKNDF